MKKLFFFDIDGTLIDCENGIESIPISTRNLLDRLKKQGDDVFLATGRCKCFILDGVIDYPFSGIVSCNGAYVEYNGKTVYKKVIPIDAIKKTHELCLKKHFAYYFESNDFIYILNRTNPKHLEFQEKWLMKDEILIDSFDLDKIETYIGMIVVNNEEDVDIMIQELSPYFDIQRHQTGLSFDLTLKGESKAKGIRKLVGALGESMEQTIAFGDGRNDIEMLSEVQIGVAMGKAAEEAKKAAQYVTDDVSNDGIMKALVHFSLLS